MWTNQESFFKSELDAFVYRYQQRMAVLTDFRAAVHLDYKFCCELAVYFALRSQLGLLIESMGEQNVQKLRVWIREKWRRCRIHQGRWVANSYLHTCLPNEVVENIMLRC